MSAKSVFFTLTFCDSHPLTIIGRNGLLNSLLFFYQNEFH